METGQEFIDERKKYPKKFFDLENHIEKITKEILTDKWLRYHILEHSSEEIEEKIAIQNITKSLIEEIISDAKNPENQKKFAEKFEKESQKENFDDYILSLEKNNPKTEGAKYNRKKFQKTYGYKPSDRADFLAYQHQVFKNTEKFSENSFEITAETKSWLQDFFKNT